MIALNYLQKCQRRVNKVLNKVLPPTHKMPHDLHKAMRYAVFNGGKRIRSALIYATGEAFNADLKVLDAISASIELIHAFSLVHDDLPALDNDSLRRGKPSCHQAFGEATAILAGDALLTLAFENLTKLDTHSINAATNLQMIKILSHYIGSCGMAGGEMLDIASIDHEISLKKLATIYKLKTSYLICACVMLGALAANCNRKTTLANLEKFGIYAGLAFQIHDDIIGIESNEKTLGKPQNSDVRNHKPTYPQLLGLTKAKAREHVFFKKAIHYLKKLNLKDNDKLYGLCKFVIARAY